MGFGRGRPTYPALLLTGVANRMPGKKGYLTTAALWVKQCLVTICKTSFYPRVKFLLGASNEFGITFCVLGVERSGRRTNQQRRPPSAFTTPPSFFLVTTIMLCLWVFVCLVSILLFITFGQWRINLFNLLLSLLDCFWLFSKNADLDLMYTVTLNQTNKKNFPPIVHLFLSVLYPTYGWNHVVLDFFYLTVHSAWYSQDPCCGNC